MDEQQSNELRHRYDQEFDRNPTQTQNNPESAAPQPNQYYEHPQTATDYQPNEPQNQPSQNFQDQYAPPTQQHIQYQAPQTGHQNNNNISLMILQWLTYAFWGWTVLALSVLTTTVVASFIDKADTGGFTPYGIAAVLVLLPIAFICDSFYVKKEPQEKHGAEIAISAIHAVLFALFGVGALITSVISVVYMLTSSSDKSGSLTILISALIIAVYYGLTFVRTLNIKALRWVTKSYRFVMIISVSVIALLGIIGPVARERATRDDRLIESNLNQVNEAIRNYHRSKQKLPANLNEITLNGDAKILVTRNLVQYKPEGLYSPDQTNINNDLPEISSLGTNKYQTNNYNNYSDNTYRYQLCVTYKEEKKDQYTSYEDQPKSEYETYLRNYSHPAGNVCYKLQTGY